MKRSNRSQEGCMESFSIVSGFHSWTFSLVEMRRPPGRSRSRAGWPDDRVDGSLWLGTHSGRHGPADLAEGGQARTTDDAQRLQCFDHDPPSP